MKKPERKEQQKDKLENALPPDVKLVDTKWPSHEKSLPWSHFDQYGMNGNALTFYLTTGFGWVLTTLAIRKARRSGSTDRSYAITLDGKCCRVGSGPHVKKTVIVYVSKDNADRLTKYCELHLKGQEQAGTVRDRISTRRAQGQIHRANGDHFWRW